VEIKFTPKTTTSRARRADRGLTLVEVMIASTVMCMLVGGILATVIQSRRLTEGSIVQNSANTILQGYIEQMKTMAFDTDLVCSPSSAPNPYVVGTSLSVPCARDETAAGQDPIYLSAGTPPATLPPIGTTPTGAVDNNHAISIKTPAVNPNDTLNLNLWLWVVDQSDPLNRPNVQQCKAITLIYTYQFLDGGRIRQVRGSLRTVRSVVPSF
jgi:Tfp pilus assembly protein PilV